MTDRQTMRGLALALGARKQALFDLLDGGAFGLMSDKELDVAIDCVAVLFGKEGDAKARASLTPADALERLEAIATRAAKRKARSKVRRRPFRSYPTLAAQALCRQPSRAERYQRATEAPVAPERDPVHDNVLPFQRPNPTPRGGQRAWVSQRSRADLSLTRGLEDVW